VLTEGGTTWAAAVATWALVRIGGEVLIGVAALRSRTACCFLMCSRLVESVGILGGAPLLLGTLGTGLCVSIERVILLSLSILDVGTHCMWGVAEGVAVSLNRSGRAFTWACVASMIR
jgi:hypothetical protein